MAPGLNSVSNRSISAVQQERKPPEPKDKIGNVATSTQKIYIRKDLSSPSAAIPTFSIKVCLKDRITILFSPYFSRNREWQLGLPKEAFVIFDAKIPSSA